MLFGFWGEGVMSFKPMFQVSGLFSGGVGGVLAQWESMGFFSYILPFLLIFALTFGILTRTRIFKDNKAVNGIIALTVGLLALQFNFVPMFFSEIFPKLGIGLAVILAGLIIIGLFLPEKEDNKYVGWFGFVIAFIVFVIVIFQSFSWSSSGFSWWFYDNWASLLAVAIVIGLIAAIMNSTSPTKERSFPEFGVPIFRSSK